eukprot:CAMPEP_0168188234 /NCGR_PEP_ID=MMETSP0139_2-20121125/15517_1 /TAXON_ID=44445 /ORGANISM="Pseudo-nitzschia australis, Strain 10249 10 AB" /LENGTH=133 /DNA_ID=CAMNT_0008110615 /DNA_START=181 /DNA_END=582 /DNA_ORIENTATION=-
MFSSVTPTPDVSNSVSDTFSSKSTNNTKPAKSIKSAKNSKSINKRKISEDIASNYDLSIAKSERIVNTVFETIAEGIFDGKEVRLSNFGKFSTFMSKDTFGRNPQTGEVVPIPPKRRIRFKAFERFRRHVPDS